MPPVKESSKVPWSWFGMASVTALAIVASAWATSIESKVDSHEKSVITLTLLAEAQQKTDVEILTSLASIETAIRELQDDSIRNKSGH